jgi:hypothetical protein
MGSTLRSERLESALASTVRPVRILDAHGDLVRLAPPAEALQIVLREPHEGGLRGAGVRYIRPIRRLPKATWVRCYRTTGAASLPVEPTWLVRKDCWTTVRIATVKHLEP